MSQSRWVQAFQQHPFQNVWTALKTEVDSAEVTDLSEINAVLEMARLKRVFTYLDKIIYASDPELTPSSTWQSVQVQAEHVLKYLQAYKTAGGVGNIASANDHADNLLTYVRPWMVTPVEAIDAVQNAALNYAKALEQNTSSFTNSATEALADIKNSRSLAASRLKGLVSTSNKIDGLAHEIFGNKSGEKSLEIKIREAVEESQKLQAQIVDFHANLLVDKAGKDSVLTEVGAAERRVIEGDKKVSAIVDENERRLADLAVFHQQIFGRTDSKTGEEIAGLKHELDERKAQLDNYEIEQQKRHDILFNKIEALLPGANSAGLASAYRAMKVGFEKLIRNYTLYFYCSLGLLGVGSMLLWVDNFTLSPFAVNFVGIKPWDELLRGLLGRAAFFIPVVWLAVFSATRRSQYERLQQEYAHKEAFASSYDSYKKELSELGLDTSELQKELLAKAIAAVAFNASVTLDGKNHIEKPPFLQFLDKADPEMVRKLAELIVNKKPVN